ncbi:MAG: penicillin-binding protein activator, partial [Bdellovibrionales bacterium]|nr:penicillin-binding protein activator [Bdellovibrionales bacterium]
RLSQKEGLTKTGQYVFRNALTSDMLVKQLVATAMEKRGYKKFAILYPNDKYGIEYANLFWDEVLRRGGEITGAQPYTSKETDFSGPIRRLVGTFYVEDRISEYRLHLKEWKKKQKRLSERNTPPTDLLPPIVDFDALFIPDGVKALGQIAPTLPYHDISNLPLMGTNLWNNSQLISRGQSLVEKSIFVDGLVTQNTNFKKTQFFNEYKKTFGLEPGMLEAQAYDIGLMLRQLINSGVNSRVELAQALSHIKTFNGSLGQLAVDESGEFTRPIYSLTVLNGKILSEDIAEMERQNATTTQ